MLAHAGTMLTPYIGLGGMGGRFDPPFWLTSSHIVPLLLSLVLFAALGLFGWLVRQSLGSEFALRQIA